MRSDESLLDAAGLPALAQATPLGGGCIALVHRLHLRDGSSVIRKSDPQAERGQFAAEAASLAAQQRYPQAPEFPLCYSEQTRH